MQNPFVVKSRRPRLRVTNLQESVAFAFDTEYLFFLAIW